MKVFIRSISKLPDDFGKNRGKLVHGPKKKKRWYDQEPTGTPEQLAKAWKVADKYIYQLINFAEKEKEVTKEEIDEARRIFAFVMQGPKASHFKLAKRTKLTSMDVIWILSSTLPASNISKLFNIERNDVTKLRRGEIPHWEWEYRFVKRLKQLLKGRLIQTNLKQRIYSVSKILSPDTKEILAYTTSQRKAVALRRSFIGKMEEAKLTKKNELDIKYPIELIELL